MQVSGNYDVNVNRLSSWNVPFSEWDVTMCKRTCTAEPSNRWHGMMHSLTEKANVSCSAMRSTCSSLYLLCYMDMHYQWIFSMDQKKMEHFFFLFFEKVFSLFFFDLSQCCDIADVPFYLACSRMTWIVRCLEFFVGVCLPQDQITVRPGIQSGLFFLPCVQ